MQFRADKARWEFGMCMCKKANDELNERFLEAPKYLKISYKLALGLCSLFVLQGPLSSVWELGALKLVQVHSQKMGRSQDSSPKQADRSR